jgi:hypothetical protein
VTETRSGSPIFQVIGSLGACSEGEPQHRAIFSSSLERMKWYELINLDSKCSTHIFNTLTKHIFLLFLVSQPSTHTFALNCALQFCIDSECSQLHISGASSFCLCSTNQSFISLLNQLCIEYSVFTLPHQSPPHQSSPHQSSPHNSGLYQAPTTQTQ